MIILVSKTVGSLVHRLDSLGNLLYLNGTFSIEL